ncbi:E3 ubiquitin-protein ligase Ubr3 isoform X2 [Diorhabda carinulata]|uniref:E3 ubiquitin-protein ligase Ubr3 isoform X2 n=1 Tax=Diorhabda carinulata TaxID=1163345 RepID=UPI0025A2C121|nr:E3 ubiquitin-protein ligase Ubr3 isoform X2 [Diorhabda carinulata]
MASTSNCDPKVLMAKGKRATATYIHADCSNERNPQHLNEVLDNLLNPQKSIEEWETIDWCKWLMAGGRTPDEFASTVRAYDNATTCGLVWTPNFVAYRCRTCGISPCMSLCTECFKKGNHARHDFNMFLSQAGGACDCGDSSVMKEAGFCERHGPNKRSTKGNAPTELMCVAEAMMPRIILRLIQHLRENSRMGTADAYKGAIQDADAFITMLLDFNNMGGLMRRVITSALTNPQKYRVLNEVLENPTTEYEQYQAESRRRYEEALHSLPNPEPIEDYKDVPSLQQNLVHKTFLEELVFWTVKFEFPQKIVCLLLNMLPDSDYKEALTRAVVLHYSRISMMLERSADPDTLSNRVVHVSVQLFSNQNLALKMTEQLNLLHVMVVSLKYMMSKILIKNTLHDQKENFHYVVDCAKPVMKDHCYWPLVSDLKNVLSHRPVALKFMSDDGLLEMWFAFLAMFQGMNVNQRELNQHIEFEPNTYYAAFSAELEASAYPMWALISHLTDASSAHLTKRVLNACLNELKDWFQAIAYLNTMTDSLQVSFHLPLHRYLAVFLSQAVAVQDVTVNEVLGSSDFFLDLLMMHPLRVQVAFYEILNGLWLRNGLQIKGQAMTYIQCNFCNSMVDADLYLLQICCTRLPAEKFLNIVIEKFHIKKWMSLAPFQGNRSTYLEGEHDTPMLESFLTFLATLVSVRTNLGLLETSLNRLEMVTLLCMGDKTHSQLMELMPERCGMSESRDFESLLAEVAFYRAPALEASGNMQQGMYVPKPEIWEKQYDPIHVLLRAVHRRDFQTSMDRYTEYARHANKLKAGCSLWPPFRTPTEVSDAYEDPRQILKSRVFHAAALIILFKAVKGLVSEHVMALVVFLLEQAVLIAARDENKEDSKMCSTSPSMTQPNDSDLSSWYAADSVFDNLKTNVGQIVIHPEPDFSPITYSSDSDIEWDSAEIDADMTDIDPLLMLDQASSNTWDNESQQQQQSESREVMVFRPQADETASPIVETPPATSRGHIFALPSATSVPMEVDRIMNLASVASITEISTHSPSETPALPPPVTRPALMAGSEVGRTVRKPTKTTSCSSTSRELVPTTSQGHRKSRSNTPLRGANNYPPVVKVNESIISLLLRLHSQLSGVPDSYNAEEEDRSSTSIETEETSVGDGVFYIGRLLQKISSLDENCRNYIQDARIKLWPSKEEREEAKKQRENREREERRRRAKERQQKLMQEFANKQKQFMEKAMECDDGIDDDDDEDNEEEKVVKQQEYDCVICNQSSPSTDEHPMGLVVLIQATSIIGHMRRHDQPERTVLPTCEEEQELLKKDDTLAAECDRRIDELDRHFDPESWFLSLNQGWDGGVHVQTCGHHLHLDCLESYLSSLRTQQRQLTLSPEKGEYLCPLCRQLANSFLPLSSQLGDKTQMVRSRPSGNMSHILEELSNFLRENDRKPNTMKMLEAIGKAMEDMSNSTQLKARFKLKNEKPIILQSLLLFVTSIARTNLEVELIQRGGSLVQFPNSSALLPKRDCIVPLLHVLAVHARVARVLAMWPAWMSFQQLCGMSSKVSVTTIAPIEREVPLLLRDPIALLLQYVLLLPMPLDQTYFTTTVQMVYNLLYYQVVAQLSCGLTGAERAKAAVGANKEHVNNLTDALGLINECLGQTDLYMDDNDDSESYSDKSVKVNMIGLELQVQKLCLPFLRIAALLKHHLYQQPLPDIYEQNNEFVRLVYYLELVTESMDWGWFNASVALTWTMDLGLEMKTPRNWCEQLGIFIGKSQLAAKGFLAEQHIMWYPPRLLQLPREYERIFTYYHERPCRQCQSVAQETSICLLCGTIVCLKQNCCKQQNVCEAVAHAAECGAGTGIFLVVTSTYIIVIRGHRACLWGSLYLDDFEEEDRDLKRGKPLYLSTARYKLLEQQWLAHRFDHTEKTWVPHRNAL